MTERVLVTGAGGFVGRHLVSRLTDDDVGIVATDLQPEPPDLFAEAVGDGLKYRTGDLTEPVFRESLLSSQFDRIYHLAAVVGVNEYVRNPLQIVKVNVEVTRKILEAIKDWDVRFVFTSTSEVYGKNPDVPWSETDDQVLGAPTTDRWSYSTTKAICEHIIHGLAQTDHPLEATVVRPFNLYGPEQRSDFVVPAFVKAVVNGERPTVYDDGTQTRCFTYIDDFIRGLLRAARDQAGKNEVFNIGQTRETTINELANTVLAVAGRDDMSPRFVSGEEVYGEGYEDLSRRVPDVSKANDKLGWTAKTDLRTGIQSTIEWAGHNYD